MNDMDDDQSILRPGTTYRLADWLSLEECRRFGVRSPGGTISEGVSWSNVRAIWTGEKRPPRKGEWYLSGATIEAYRAPNDLGESHVIAQLVLTQTRTVVDIAE